MQNTLLSVILPVHNGMPFLVEAIQSLLTQSFQDFIVLVLDNGSNDETSNYINELRNDKIKYFRLNETNLVKALNMGVESADTPFIARMDSDDISDPRRFEKQIKFLNENVEIDIVGSNGYYISVDNKRRIKINLPLSHDRIIQSMLQKRNAIIHGSIMLRSKVFKSHGYYDASSFPCEDYELFLRIGNNIKFANMSERLYSFRVRENSIMSNQIKQSMKLYYSINHKYSHKYFKNIYTNEKADQKLKFFEILDVLSVSIYRRGLNYFLNVNIILGIFFFIFASIVNPLRLIHSIKRKIGFC